MAIAIANFYSAQQTGSGQTVAATGVTIPNGAVVIAIGTQALTGTTETVAGNTVGSFTFRVRYQNTMQASLFTYVHSAAQVTGETITYDAGATFRNPTVGVWVITGADTATLTDYATGFGTGTGFSVSPTASAADSYTVGGFALNGAQSGSPDGNSTENIEYVDGTNGIASWFGRTTSTGGPGSLPVGGSWASGAAWAGVAIAINQGTTLVTDSIGESATPSDAIALFGPVRYPQAASFQASAFQPSAFQYITATGTVVPISDDQTETVTATDSVTGLLLIRRTHSESTTATDGVAGGTPQQDETTSANLGVVYSDVSGNIIPQTETASATASEEYTPRYRGGNIETESVTATDSATAALSIKRTHSESTAATDSEASVIASVSGVSHGESTTPSDSYISVQVSGSDVAFTATARDSAFRAVPGGFDIGQVYYDSVGTWRVDITDLPNGRNVFTATDGYYIVEAELDVIPTSRGMVEIVIDAGAAGVAQYVTDNWKTEWTVPSIALSETQAYAPTAEEAATVADAYEAALENTRQTETATVSDAYATANTVLVTQSESATVTDAYQSSTTTGTGGAGRFRVWDGGGWV